MKRAGVIVINEATDALPQARDIESGRSHNELLMFVQKDNSCLQFG